MEMGRHWALLRIGILSYIGNVRQPQATHGASQPKTAARSHSSPWKPAKQWHKPVT